MVINLKRVTSRVLSECRQNYPPESVAIDASFVGIGELEMLGATVETELKESGVAIKSGSGVAQILLFLKPSKLTH